MQPVAIDLFCGLGGWTDGLLAEGYRVIGYDIEAHEYGEQRYPGELVLADVMSLDGAQFKDAALIVASPPCQEYSYMAMPWSRAKQIARALRGEGDFPDPYTGSRTVEQLTALFNASFRIQREASAAAGRHIPLVVENVKGATPWVGRARWNYGSFYLWGDVPALMPATIKAQKFNPDGTQHGQGSWFKVADSKNRGARGDAGKMQCSAAPRMWRDREVPRLNDFHKNTGGSWFNIGSPGQKVTGKNPVHELSGTQGSEGYERDHPKAFGWKKPGTSRHSKARKMASAMIAKIPLPLSRHIARTYHPAPQSIAAE